MSDAENNKHCFRDVVIPEIVKPKLRHQAGRDYLRDILMTARFGDTSLRSGVNCALSFIESVELATQNGKEITYDLLRKYWKATEKDELEQKGVGFARDFILRFWTGFDAVEDDMGRLGFYTT